ncbi:glycosyltransferase [Flavimaricola marinus]|uniref:Chondroitin synthase n=1 Tax=Flavimaricola marinus TaxID=1819565 RepID=A0A238LK31_9RHOB|nr:glycosyltransferase [Flavimaricola marinus]SMY09230.1 Chondroitin synthase [Flavimaricola marinus]
MNISAHSGRSSPSATNPRNVWSKLLRVLALVEDGQAEAAAAALEAVKYDPNCTSEILAVYARQVARAAEQSPFRPRIDIPAQYLGRTDGLLRPPLRRLDPQAEYPSPYPWGMGLPAFPGAQNDSGFILDAATTLAPYVQGAIGQVHVLYSVEPGQNAGQSAAVIADLAADLAAQDFAGEIGLTVFGAEGRALPEGIATCAQSLMSEPGQARLTGIAEDADLLVFLSGQVRLDKAALARAAHLAAVSDAVVQTIVPDAPKAAFETPFTLGPLRKAHNARYPFRAVAGLNMALTPALLARTGVPDARFEAPLMAGRELAFRAHNLGAYFVPLAVPVLVTDDASSDADSRLYTQLCPNHWDRKKDGRFEVPKVSVYIPAYNAGKYIERAIDSILAQDVTDLEICISDDGSRDNTREILSKTYGSEPRVRYQANPNGGIGFASNNAIRMSRGIYIGQLDSDDALKPGAVRRLMEHLDEHPDVACAYGSCERVDAAGNYLQNEYAWPVFSREKMMITSIAHHFRMFRRAAWERTTGFREDIVNAVDYDIFLKLSEVGRFHHVEEILYQRRWHGENTSSVNEVYQTSNTYRVQREALARQGLGRYWDVHIPDPKQPRRVTYRRKDDTRIVLFWPDYSRSNPYQKLLYQTQDPDLEIVAGDIDAALRMLELVDNAGDVTFHLHWLNFVLLRVTDRTEAVMRVEEFYDKLHRFVAAGGHLIWTVHNTVSHDATFADLEADLSKRIVALAETVHIHSEGAVEEVRESFSIPPEKVRVSRHGHYIGAYPDFVSREAARDLLGLSAEADVVLFTGQIRPYKGAEALIGVFRTLLASRPNAVLLLAGVMQFDLLAEISPALSQAERARIRTTDRFLDDMEMQLFFRAADIAVYPYQKILTSGSLMLALSYGVPAVIPRVAMTAEVLDGHEAGMLYDPSAGVEALDAAVRSLLEAKDEGRLETIAQNARARAEALDWPDAAELLAPVAANRPEKRV